MPVRVVVRDLGGHEDKPWWCGLVNRDTGSEQYSAIADGWRVNALPSLGRATALGHTSPLLERIV